MGALYVEGIAERKETMISCYRNLVVALVDVEALTVYLEQHCEGCSI